jgi:hypothetical protein
MADLELHMGNEQLSHRGGTGLGIYYTRNIEKISHKDSIFGYSNVYQGLGIYLNTILVSNVNGEMVNSIQGYYNDGSKHINVFSEKDHTCFRQLRNFPNNAYFKIRIQYEHPLLTVSYFNQKTFQYEICFTMEADLQFNGYFLLSGASGVQFPDHIYLKSFKLYNTKEYANNEHFQEARRAKAAHEHMDETLAAIYKDLIINRSKKDAT